MTAFGSPLNVMNCFLMMRPLFALLQSHASQCNVRPTCPGGCVKPKLGGGDKLTSLRFQYSGLDALTFSSTRLVSL